MKINIGDKEFTLKYNNLALFKIEEELDKSIVEIFNDSKEMAKLKTVFVLVHSGIQEDISFEDFANLATFDDLAPLSEGVGLEIAKSFDAGSKKK